MSVKVIMAPRQAVAGERFQLTRVFASGNGDFVLRGWVLRHRRPLSCEATTAPKIGCFYALSEDRRSLVEVPFARLTPAEAAGVII